MKRYRVWLRSKPGFYEQYDGKIDVYADSDEQAIDEAFRELKHTFPERGRSMWKVEKVEVIG